MQKLTAFLPLAWILLSSPAGAQSCERMHKPKHAGPPIIGFRYGTPQKLSFYAGPAWQLRASQNCIDALTATVDLGAGGVQASGGYMLSRSGAGYVRLQESVLRTWGQPLDAPARRVYMGTELQWSLLIGVRVGRYYQVGGPGPRANLTTISVVLGM